MSKIEDAMKIYEILGMIYFRFCQTLPPNRQFTPKLGDSHTKRTYWRETCCQRSPPNCSFNSNEGQENKQKSIKHDKGLWHCELWKCIEKRKAISYLCLLSSSSGSISLQEPFPLYKVLNEPFHATSRSPSTISNQARVLESYESYESSTEHRNFPQHFRSGEQIFPSCFFPWISLGKTASMLSHIQCIRWCICCIKSWSTKAPFLKVMAQAVRALAKAGKAFSYTGPAYRGVQISAQQGSFTGNALNVEHPNRRSRWPKARYWRRNMRVELRMPACVYWTQCKML